MLRTLPPVQTVPALYRRTVQAGCAGYCETRHPERHRPPSTPPG